MKIKTALNKEFDCEAITMNPSPPRLYLHLVNTGMEEVNTIFGNNKHLPIEGYPAFNAVQSISPEGVTSVKVSLKMEVI